LSPRSVGVASRPASMRLPAFEPLTIAVLPM
jgi:hypothetical protein